MADILVWGFHGNGLAKINNWGPEKDQIYGQNVCSWIIGVKPDVAFCCCSPSSSSFCTTSAYCVIRYRHILAHSAYFLLSIHPSVICLSATVDMFRSCANSFFLSFTQLCVAYIYSSHFVNKPRASRSILDAVRDISRADWLASQVSQTRTDPGHCVNPRDSCLWKFQENRKYSHQCIFASTTMPRLVTELILMLDLNISWNIWLDILCCWLIR